MDKYAYHARILNEVCFLGSNLSKMEENTGANPQIIRYYVGSFDCKSGGPSLGGFLVLSVGWFLNGTKLVF